MVVERRYVEKRNKGGVGRWNESMEKEGEKVEVLEEEGAEGEKREWVFLEKREEKKYTFLMNNGVNCSIK